MKMLAFPESARPRNISGGKPVSREGQTTLTAEAYARLEEMIVTLELSPGAVVSEAILSRQLDIGTTPIREALHRLSREYLVQIIPRRGVVVTSIDVRLQFEVLETRRERHVEMEVPETTRNGMQPGHSIGRDGIARRLREQHVEFAATGGDRVFPPRCRQGGCRW